MNHPKATGWTVAAITLVLLLPVLYVLSLGPAARLNSKGILAGSTLEFVYWPIEAAAERSRVIMALATSYVQLWDPDRYEPRGLSPPNLPTVPLPATPAVAPVPTY